MGSEPGYPFQGEIWYWNEASYGGGESGTTMRISDKVLDVRIDTGDVHRTLHDISEPSVCAFVETGGDVTLHVEWIYQPNALGSLASDCVNRTLGDLQDLAFCVGTSTKRATSSYYYLVGGKCKTFNFNGTRGDDYKCSADFSIQSVTTSTTATGSAPAALATDYATFNAAGTITFTGGYTAYITDSINVDVNNNLSDYMTVGSSAKLCAIPGKKDVTGSADLSLDEGGALAWYNIANLTAITSLVINTGRTTGDHGKLTLSTGRYDNLSVDVNQTDSGMMASIPFTFKDIAFATGT